MGENIDLIMTEFNQTGRKGERQWPSKLILPATQVTNIGLGKHSNTNITHHGETQQATHLSYLSTLYGVSTTGMPYHW